MARPHADVSQERRVAGAVFELVAARGVDGTSMRSVAAATGLSTGTLNYHYGSKRGLLLAAIDHAYQLPHDWAQHAGEPRRALSRLFSRYLLRKPSVKAWWRFFCAITAAAADDSELAARQLRTQERLMSFFASVLSDGVERGKLAPELNVDITAQRLVALAHGLALQQLIDDSRATSLRCEAILAAEIDALPQLCG